MISENDYLKAVEIVKSYHQQITKLITEISDVKPLLAKKVVCVKSYAGGHDLYFLTAGKEYDIIPKIDKWDNSVSDRRFYILDDNGKKREYYYHNPQGVFSFVF